MKNDVEKVLVSEEQIEEICERLGKVIDRDYKDKKPLVVGLLRGCVPFIGDLMKHTSIMLEVDFMDVSSYHGGTESSGDVKILKDLDSSVEGRHVIIAEDIVDTGRTIKKVINLLLYRNAASVEVVTLLDKPAGREVDLSPKYVGVTIPKEFVIGYGLDYDQFYRNLPYVGVLKKEVYTK